jgi:tape measure domain-containing protein
MADEKLIFPIGFDLEEGVKKASRDWKNHYRKRLQDAMDSRPLKVKIDFESKGINPKEFKQWMALSREAEKLERERIKNAREWQKVADQAAMAETRRANATNESNARIERANRTAEASERRKRDAVERTNDAYKRQGGYLQRLFQRMVAYASVTQAFSFIRNIREVTAQFELQRVALGSIIGDLNEANAMFEQIKAAAVKSPFQIKELVTYTKQLAAYKIETDELFETTQKLADISAGLGVSMDRLVLAYGQIRATGYLRASEVRQLNEAGIPIVEELAKKMSELRGETVSAAEVMGMISDRAISFGMVKEVFDDMTSAGGMFYKMQEKQAETLAGQWSNLQDSIAIMYEEIGNTEGVNNAIKGMIGLIKSLAENWRDVWSVVQSLSVAMGVYYVAMKNAAVASKALTIEEAKRNVVTSMQLNRAPKVIAMIIGENNAKKLSILFSKQLYKAQLAEATATGLLTKAWAKLRIAMLSNPYTAVLAALAGITVWVTKFATKTKTTQERIEDLNESVASLNELSNPNNGVRKLIDEFDELSQKANKTAQEQARLNQVTRELASVYPSAISGARNYGDELDVNIGKVKELYEAEKELREEKVRRELAANEAEYAELEALYNDYISKINKGTYKQPVVNQNTDEVSYYDKAYTEEQLAALGEQALEVADKMHSLDTSIRDAKIALGELDEEGETVTNTLNTWQSELASIIEGYNLKGEGIRLFDDESITQITKLTDATARVAEAYNRFAKEKERVDSALLSEGAKEEAEVYEQLEGRLEGINGAMSLLYDFLKKYNALDLIAEGDTPPEKNPRIALLNEELSTVEKIYKEYQELRKFMRDDDARARVADMFEDVNLTMLSQALSPTEMRAQLQKALDEAKKMGDKAQILELEYKLGKFDADETQRQLEESLKDLSDKISRTKTAKEFFDRMLGMTGDKELSATLTLSVYGTTGDDLQRLMTQQVEEAFRNVDISSARLGDGKFDYNILAGLIEHLPKEQRQNAQSIVDNWRKANDDILTDLQKSYEAFMTYEERKTRVVERQIAERKKIEESLYDDDEKAKLIEASEKRRDRELADIAIEEFKASEDWAKSFEDLENLATPTIERLMAKLKEFIDTQEDLTPEQLRTLMTEYNKLYNGLIARNPIQAITDSIKEYRTAMQGVKLAQDTLDAAKAMGDDDLIAWAERGLTDAFDEAQKAASKLQKGLSGVSDKFSQAQQFVSSFADTLGISEDTEFGAFLGGISDALGGVSKAFSFAVLAVQIFDGSIKAMLASNPIGWILLAVSAIISAVQAIANARVKRIDKDIEILEDRLDSLSYAYERLQKAQEKTFGGDYISNYEQRLANLQAQQEAYLKQAELERSKGKKADEEKIKEYEAQARDTADAIKDMQSELSEHFLGTDLTSAARDFANAWIDAYKEFGSTTDAMKAKFQDMIQNMIVESFAARVIQTALEPIFDSIDNMTKDGVLDMSEASKIANMTEVAVGNIDVGMNNLMNALAQAGLSVRGMGSNLTGISRDIATASEESILGLAAGINTQNFYISQVPTKLDTIIGLLRGENAMQGSTITLQDLVTMQNQHLSHLPSIAQHTAETVAECKAIVVETRRTANALERVIKPDGTRPTYKLNVVTSYQG